jgi:hypothetical protein
VQSPDTSCNRRLMLEEASCLNWLLSRPGSTGMPFLPQVQHARVVAACACGCATVHLAVDAAPVQMPHRAVLAERRWRTESGGACCVIVLASEGWLSKLEVYSLDGQTSAPSLPRTDQLTAGW